LKSIAATTLSRLFESHLSNEAIASTCGQDRCKEVPTVSSDARKYFQSAAMKGGHMPTDNKLYDRLASTWWDENEVLNVLRISLNPARFSYFRTVLLEQEKIDPGGKKTLDVGCGGGLLAEEFARLGCDVTGIDPSEPSIAVAKAHATQEGLAIEYLTGVGESLHFADASFDIVYCCDVLEHVNDLGAVISEIARVLKKDGFFFYDTINRTFMSNIISIKLLQEWKATRVMPANLHDWKLFVKPSELQAHMSAHKLEQKEIFGLVPNTNPITLFRLLRKYKRGVLPLKEVGTQIKLVKSKDTSNLYMGYAIKV
jgi:2-polyprenyl-6-hydroxyphenyl methylase/3-demethylubiquinone-9 3-methyltransferase